jgi:hypothetical protein
MNAAAKMSARPTILATASTFTGCAANSAAPASAGPVETKPVRRKNNSTEAVACVERVGYMKAGRSASTDGPVRGEGKCYERAVQREPLLIEGPVARRQQASRPLQRVDARVLLDRYFSIVREVVAEAGNIQSEREQCDE